MLKLSEIHRILNAAATERAMADYHAYVAELQARKDGTLIDGTYRVVDQTAKSITSSTPPADHPSPASASA